MSSKKVWIIIVLAGILAFITAAVIIDKIQNKPTKPVVQEEVSTIEEIVKPVEEAIVEKEVTKSAPAPKKIIKKTAPKPKNIVKDLPAPKAVEVQKQEPVAETVTQEETSNEIIILNEYKSQNSYKYTYTPVRYKSK